MLFSNRKIRGFTLIELILVILIIGLLVAIAIPAIFGMRRKAKESDARAACKDIGTAIAQMLDDAKVSVPLPAADGSQMIRDMRDSQDATGVGTFITTYLNADGIAQHTMSFPYLSDKRFTDSRVDATMIKGPWDNPYSVTFSTASSKTTWKVFTTDTSTPAVEYSAEFKID